MPEHLVLEKAYSFVNMGFSTNDLKELKEMMKRVPETFTKCLGINAKNDTNFCAPDTLNLDVFFEYYTENLLK